MEETGSSSVGLSGASGSSDSLNGLKFGKKIYFEDVGIGVSAKSGGGSSSVSVGPVSVVRSAPPPAKKGRVVLHGGQTPRCQVEGCVMDLSGSKAYYSRHKVCATHSKSPKVIVAGLEQRFCQQCSRFHQLPEFDQGKRSCRRRLAGHNERRRKPAVGSFSSSRYGRPSSSLHESSNGIGGFLMDFTTYPRLPARDQWPTMRASEHIPGNQPTSMGRSFLPHLYQGSSENPPGNNFLQGLAGGTVFPSRGLPSGEGFAGVSASSCALSLLSCQPWGSRNRGLAMNHHLMNDVGATPMVQSAAPHGAVANNFTSSGKWGFKGNEASSSSSHEMPNELGFGQVSQLVNNQFSGEVAQQVGRQYMELGQSRGFCPSHQQIN